MIWTALAAAVAVSPALPGTPPRPPALPAAITGGAFVDRTGTRHPWQINRAHALLWDGKPYVPAGVELHVEADARSTRFAGTRPPDAGGDTSSTGGTAVDGSASNARSAAGTIPPGPDVAKALDLLAAHGIQDLCLARAGGWLSGDGSDDQALVDQLEARGLRYGIALDVQPSSPLSGYMVVPQAIEVPAEWRQPGRRLSWSVDLPGARQALYALVDLDGDGVIAAGQVPVTEDKAHIEIAFRPARRMFLPGPARLLVIPERTTAGPPEEQPVDFWSGWTDAQARLIGRLTRVKWGPGLRFFARLVPPSFGLRGEVEDLVPDSGGFRLQFESWLEQRYSVGDLNNQWALNDRQAGSLAIAARLVPLWGREERGERSGWLIDPVTNEWYRADLRRSAFWRDFARFRADSIRQTLGDTATLIKKVAANVPVLWEWTEYHPLFTNPQEVGGLDGVSFAPTGWGQEAAGNSGAFAFAQSEESARPSWLIDIGHHPGSAPPPGSSEELRLDWNWLREIGCKGFFADGLSASNSDQRQPETAPAVNGGGGREAKAPSATWDLAQPAERLDWIRDYREQVLQGESVADYRPAALYFPSDAVGMGLTGRLDSGVWWLPSFAPGQHLVLGETIEGYWIARSPDPAPSGAGSGLLVLWSTGGQQKATFVMPNGASVQLYDPLGRPLKPAVKRGHLQLSLDTSPILVTGLGVQNLFPMETTTQALGEFEALVKAAEAQKMNVAPFRLALNQAKTLFRPSTAATTYEMIRAPLAMLRAALTPYIWIEGETAARHNWNGVRPEPRASAGGLLYLDRATAPGSGSYQARYAFTIEREATYEVWFAGSVPGSKGTSPFTWRIDDHAPSLIVADETTHRYAGSLAWTRLGHAPLAVGRHTLTITATEPATDSRDGGGAGYHLVIDALVLSREPFQPEGIRRPEFRLARDMEYRPNGSH